MQAVPESDPGGLTGLVFSAGPAPFLIPLQVNPGMIFFANGRSLMIATRHKNNKKRSRGPGRRAQVAALVDAV